MPSPTQRRGYQIESQALAYLQQHGLHLLERNYLCKAGEIDLVMRDRNAIQPAILVFVEVRYRASASHGGAAASVSWQKRRKLRNTAQHYRLRRRQHAGWPIRFDVVAVHGSLDNAKIVWLPGAFEC